MSRLEQVLVRNLDGSSRKKWLYSDEQSVEQRRPTSSCAAVVFCGRCTIGTSEQFTSMRQSANHAPESEVALGDPGVKKIR